MLDAVCCVCDWTELLAGDATSGGGCDFEVDCEEREDSGFFGMGTGVEFDGVTWDDDGAGVDGALVAIFCCGEG